MARILYTLAQEGRGHSSRSYEIIRRLAAKKHDITILTGGDSFEPLQEALKGIQHVELIRIPGLRFTYDSKGNVNYFKTVSGNLKVISKGKQVIRQIENMISGKKIDLVICDMEPFGPRAAKNKGVKFITIDNQHRFVFEKSSHVPSGRHALSFLLTTQIIKHYHPLGNKCIITSAFVPELDYKKFVGKVEVHAVGPIIRKEVELLKRKVKKEDFILVYVKSQLEGAILPKLKLINDNFVMYVKDPQAHGKKLNIEYKKHSISGFAKDMAKCKAVISSAGETVMSEALFLGKPLFLMPEEGTYEQKLNAELVKLYGVGSCRDITKVSSDDLVDFLSNLEEYEKNIKKLKITNGANEVVSIILSELNG